MNYQKIYDQLIDRSKIRGKIFPVERHHIVPVSMGGTNKKENIAHLTPREHLIAHILLWKIYRNNSMSAAIWFMAHSRGIRINSRTYELLRIEFSKNASIYMSNRIVTQETRDNMSKSFTGRIFTEEHKANIGKSSKGRKSPMKGIKLPDDEDSFRIRSERRKGKGLGNAGWPGERSSEYKEKISKACIGHKPSHFKEVSVNGKIYKSVAEAARSLNVTYNWLIRRIRMEKYIDYFYTKNTT